MKTKFCFCFCFLGSNQMLIWNPFWNFFYWKTCQLFEKVLNRDKTTEVITYCPDCMLFAHELMMCLCKFRLRHRGPDWSGLHCHGDCYLAHQRLAIVDPASGDQPLYNEDKTIVVTVLFFWFSLPTSICLGEIYIYLLFHDIKMDISSRYKKKKK